MYFKNSNKNELINYKVGIVAVSHKRFGELKVFVQSIINQTNKNWSLHVIHDGKNDEFLNIKWPINYMDILISEKDANAAKIRDLI